MILNHELFTRLSELPQPASSEQSFEGMLKGKVMADAQVDRQGRVVFSMQRGEDLIWENELDRQLLLESTQSYEGYTGPDMADEVRFDNNLENLRQRINPQFTKHLSQQLTQLVVASSHITLHQLNHNTLAASPVLHLATGRISQFQHIRVPSDLKWSQRLDDSMRGPHQVRFSSKKKTSQESEQKQQSKDLLRQMQILGEILEQIVGQKKRESKEDYFRQIMKVVNLNPRWTFQDQSQDTTSSQTYNEFFLSIYDRIKDKEPEPEPQLLFPKPNDPITEAMLDSILTQIIQQDSEHDQPQIVRHFAAGSGKTHHFAEQDKEDISHFYDVLPKDKFAMQFPFELDQFQKRAILRLQKNQSVFIAAHTSAGKTVIAQYGIALAAKHKRKAIYTSPIKALSNQKFFDFQDKFQSVGIQTGDVSVNPTASCVIMTTEILRNCLYKGADMVRDIQWVIFDEVHYVNNEQRGVVWQQTILLLPESIGIIMLSATVPNYMDFADWVGRTKRKKIFVTKTLYRPVPLEHSIYMLGQFHVIKEPNGKFLKQEYKELQHMISSAKLQHQDMLVKKRQDKHQKIQTKGFWNDTRRQKMGKYILRQAINKFIKKVRMSDLDSHALKTQGSALIELVIECQKKLYLPCVLFCFSKKKIQELSAKIYSHALNNNSDKNKVIAFFRKATAHLKPEDRQLPQLQQIFELAKNGYAVHHGDLMPICKEIVQLLFSEGLIKLLLATETFAMGINMPTKTVIFHSIKKVDASASNFMQRFLNSSQYVQMSGRAGRRGLDEKGNVIIWVKDPQNLPHSSDMQRMIDFQGESLVSKFRVTYGIILNLLLSKDLNVIDMIKNSFLQNQKFSAMPLNKYRIQKLKEEFDALSQFNCEYQALTEPQPPIFAFKDILQAIRSSNPVSEYLFNKLELPKLVILYGQDYYLQLGCAIKAEKDWLHVILVKETNFQHNFREKQFLSKAQRRHIKIGNQERHYRQVKGTHLQYSIVKVHYEQVMEVLQQNIFKGKRTVSDQSYESYESMAKILDQIARELDLVSLMAERKGKQLLNKNNHQLTQALFIQYRQSKCAVCKHRDRHVDQMQRRTGVKQQLQELIARMDQNDLSKKASFMGMVRVLKQRGFVDKDEMILLKGRIARQIGDIYITQVMLEGILNQLSPAGIAAVLSGFINQYKPRSKANSQKDLEQDPPELPAQVWKAQERVFEVVRQLSLEQVKHAAFLVDEPQDLVRQCLNFSLFKQMYWWADGMDFLMICQFTQAQQGIIVRTILRLQILLRNLIGGCRLAGNERLSERLGQCSQRIKRDVVFSQSLYLR